MTTLSNQTKYYIQDEETPSVCPWYGNKKDETFFELEPLLRKISNLILTLDNEDYLLTYKSGDSSNPPYIHITKLSEIKTLVIN